MILDLLIVVTAIAMLIEANRGDLVWAIIYGICMCTYVTLATIRAVRRAKRGGK